VLSKNSGAFALTAIATKNSTEGANHQSPSAVWADTGDSPGTSQAVLATADDNWAARLLNNSSSHPALGAQNDAAAGALVLHTIGGTVGGWCAVRRELVRGRWFRPTAQRLGTDRFGSHLRADREHCCGVPRIPHSERRHSR
jgi:hypothetical protein